MTPRSAIVWACTQRSQGAMHQGTTPLRVVVDQASAVASVGCAWLVGLQLLSPLNSEQRCKHTSAQESALCVRRVGRVP